MSTSPRHRPPAASATLGIALTAGLVTVLLVRLALRPTLDVDTWLHLRIGAFLWDGGRFDNLPDPWVLLADRPYLPTQWLGQMVGALVERHFGLLGVESLYAGCLLALVAGLVVLARRCAPPTIVALVIPLCVVPALTNLSQRPQMAGFVILALLVQRWWLTLQDGRIRWSVAALTWALAWVHGLWTIGVALNILFAAVVLLAQPTVRRKWRALAALWLSAIALTAATPLGPRAWALPFVLAGSASGRAEEWQPPGAQSPFALVLLALVLMTAAALLFGRRRARRADAAGQLPTRDGRPGAGRWVLLVGVLILGFSMNRLLTPAVIVLTPVLAESLTRALGLRVDRPDRSERRTWAVAALAVTIIVGVSVAGFDASARPVAPAVDAAVDALPDGTRIVGDAHLTGWLVHDHPDLRLLTDLRYELYSPATIADADALLAAAPGWPTLLRDNAITAVLVARDGPLATALGATGAWSVRASDTHYSLLVKGPDPAP